MDIKTKLLMPLSLALGLILVVFTLLSANFWLDSRAWAAGLLESNDMSIAYMTPNKGENDQPTEVYIYGSGFTEPLTVMLGNEQLEEQYVASQYIIAIVPAGLNPGFYDLTVETASEEDTLYDAFEVLGVLSDLRAHPEWLWSDPAPLRVGLPGRIGLVVQHLYGERTEDSVWVEFEVKPRGGQFEPLGRSQTIPLAPNATESTEPLDWEPEEAGLYLICAQIDPDNHVSEIDEENNFTCREVRVLPAPPEPPDVVPPTVEDFKIYDDGDQTTTQETVMLDVTATDQPPEPISGMRQVKFIEFEYILEARRWVAVQQKWVNYPPVDYSWTLSPTYGMHYMQAWAMDNARNISLAPSADFINLLPSGEEGFVAQGDVVFYRVSLNDGDPFTATLTVREGEDADLYAWGPNAELLDYSNNQTGVDQVTFKAQLGGTYQIEVHGVTDAHYQLTFGETTIVPEQSVEKLSRVSKRVPSAPAVPVDDVPEYIEVNPPYEVYLPISVR